MPIRWVVCPIVTERGVRKAKVGTLIDAGKPPAVDPDTGDPIPRTYSYSACIDVVTWALCVVRYVSVAGMDADPQIVNLFEHDYEDEAFFDTTPRAFGWNNPRLNRVRNRLSQQGVSTTGLTADTPMREWLLRLGTAVRAEFDPRGHRTQVRI